MKRKMKTQKIFEIGEQVKVQMRVASREFDERGNIKYTLKDEKTGKILGWYYSDRDIIPVAPSKKKKEV